MEASPLLNDINKISNSIAIEGNYNEKGLDELKVSPCADQVVCMSVSKAEKRLKKLERDYQHTYENYIETRSNRYRFYIIGKHSNYRSRQAGNCIKYYKNLQDQLQNNLANLNKAEATQRRTEKPDYCKQFSMLHGCKSLAQEKRILQQIGETQQQHLQNNDLQRQEIKHFKDRNWEFRYNQRIIPKSSSRKVIHDLLRRFKDTEKLRDKSIANGEVVYNATSQDSLIISIKRNDICFPTDSDKERDREIMIDNGYEEKIRHLENKCEWICGKWDEEKKYILGLKQNT
ncbi:unnamed protein product, partial [Thlaspi arvense]